MNDKRIEAAARALFPDDIPPKENCYNEVHREGLPCRICEYKVEVWAERLEQVKAALQAADRVAKPDVMQVAMKYAEEKREPVRFLMQKDGHYYSFTVNYEGIPQPLPTPPSPEDV
jgi:hypothetical protein